MSNRTAPRSPFTWCAAVVVVGLAACGEAQKPGDAKPGVVEAAGKDGLSESVLAGQLATAMISGEGEKGLSSIGPGQSLQGHHECSGAQHPVRLQFRCPFKTRRLGSWSTWR